MKGHVSIMKLLIQHGADANSCGGYYGNALQAAAYRGHKTAAEVLLDAGADVYKQGFSRDAFHAAAEGGHEEIVCLFLEKGFKFYHPLPRDIPCAMRPSIKRAKKSRERHSDQRFTSNWQHCLSISDFHRIPDAWKDGEVLGEDEDTEPYQSSRYDSRRQQNYALQAAASKGCHSVVKLMLDRWESLDISSAEVYNALIEASTNGREEVVRLFTNSKLDIVSYVEEALEAAALHGHLAIVDMLLAYEEASTPDYHRKPQAYTPSERASTLFKLSSHKACHPLCLLDHCYCLFAETSTFHNC